MKPGMDWQVTNLELSRKLKELGVPQESEFIWVNLSDTDYPSYLALRRRLDYEEYFNLKEPDRTNSTKNIFSTFTVAELGEMLPPTIHFYKNVRNCKLWSANHPKFSYTETADTEADCRAKMLIYLIEKGIGKV